VAGDGLGRLGKPIRPALGLMQIHIPKLKVQNKMTYAINNMLMQSTYLLHYIVVIMPFKNMARLVVR
jgi:hypothetical protein